MEVLLGASIALDGFGSGSSREDAVRALKGAGVEAVIAKSFAFICEMKSHSHTTYY
jgi:3-isopropylmalate dehydratase small subunit